MFGSSDLVFFAFSLTLLLCFFLQLVLLLPHFSFGGGAVLRKEDFGQLVPLGFDVAICRPAAYLRHRL